MIKHTENVARITASRVVETGKFLSLEVDYVTAGGIHKTMRLAHSDADWLRVCVTDGFAEIPKEKRRKSFFASLRRKR